MNKILSSALLLLAGVSLFTACSDDNDSNPTLPKLPQENAFQLNTPAFASTAVLLAESDALHFTWSQPAYGFPAAMQYVLQLSVTGTFNTSLAEAEADETGATRADYAEVETAFVTPEASVKGSDMARLLQRICLWAEDAVPAAQTITARVLSYINGAANVDSLYSNPVSFTVAPYYVELSAAEPVIWYLVGGTIGDGAWGNASDKIGTSLMPMSTLAGEEYDKVKGTGKIGYTGYFIASQGFKLVLVPGSWDEQIGQGSDGYVRNDGGSGNLSVPEDGYYSIVFDTSTDCDVTISKLDATPATYTAVSVIGAYGDWDNDVAMTPVSTFDGAINHDWWCDFDATAGDTELKFRANNSWDINWGASTFPTGFGAQNGPNIPVAAGSYRIIFNDITGTYTFIEK